MQTYINVKSSLVSYDEDPAGQWHEKIPWSLNLDNIKLQPLFDCDSQADNVKINWTS